MIKCPNCNKTLGLEIEGTYRTICPRCKKYVVIKSPSELPSEMCAIIEPSRLQEIIPGKPLKTVV